jgi:hypothetical protein
VRTLQLCIGSLLIGALLADPIALKVQGPDTAGNLLQMAIPGTTPAGQQTPLAAVGTGVNASTSATLTAAVGKTNFLSGFDVYANGATAASVQTVTITGLAVGTLTYSYAIGNSVNTDLPHLIEYFNPPLPASATNTAIVVTCTAAGTGNTQQCVAAWGFQQ